MPTTTDSERQRKVAKQIMEQRDSAAPFTGAGGESKQSLRLGLMDEPTETRGASQYQPHGAAS